MRILHNAIPFTFSNLQVQFQAGHGHKHPFLVIEQGEHKIHTKAGKTSVTTMRVSLLRSFPETKDACRETSR